LSKGEKYTLDKVLLMDMIMKLHFWGANSALVSSFENIK
jgi:hypothetical protein